MRSDARANRRRILDAAVIAVKRDGLKVPMDTVAREAGVGVGTLYRHFPDREELLAGLTERSFELVLENARLAAATDGPGIGAIAAFLSATIEDRAELVLPLHGGPPTLDRRSSALQAEVRDLLERILRRAREDGSVRRDVTGIDVILFGAMLAQPLPHVPDWEHVASRQAQIFLSGLADVDALQLP